MRRRHWHRRPPWWPPDEPWPPGPDRARGARFFFLARAAAVLVVVFMLSTYGGLTLFRGAIGRLWPFALLLVVFAFLLTMRRFGRPLGNLVEAAERVANGDFGVRVAEYGPPWLRSVAAAFNSMTTRLELQRRHRRDLMADVAHELRTPLAVMQGRLEGMIDGVYPRDERQIAQVLDETRMLARLVDDLRTLAHSESGTLALQKETTDITLLIEETVAAFRPQAQATGVTIDTDIPEDLPLVDVDPLRCREVLTNLLSNAVRYSSPGGGVNVDVQRHPDAIVIRVRDKGRGIAAEDVPHIFDRFYKGETSTGSGLGLTIARNLVHAHGGTITAESREGAGTVMEVRLPLSEGR